MTFDPDDPKWTAYVLGELDDDARGQVEAELAASPDAQRAVDEIRRTIEMVSAGLAAELLSDPAGAEVDAGDLTGEPTVVGSIADEPAEVALANADAGDAAGEIELAHPVRPAGHTRVGGRLPILALAASLLAVVGLGGFLLSGGGQLRKAIMSMKFKGGSYTAPRVKTDNEPLDGSKLDGGEMGSRPTVSPYLNVLPDGDARPYQTLVEPEGESAETRPSPWYQTDDVEYFAPGPEFRLGQSRGSRPVPQPRTAGEPTRQRRPNGPEGAPSHAPAVDGTPSDVAGSVSGDGEEGEISYEAQQFDGPPVRSALRGHGGYARKGNPGDALGRLKQGQDMGLNGALKDAENARSYGYYPKHWKRWPASDADLNGNDAPGEGELPDSIAVQLPSFTVTDVDRRYARAAEELAHAEYDKAVQQNQSHAGAIPEVEINRLKLVWHESKVKSAQIAAFANAQRDAPQNDHAAEAYEPITDNQFLPVAENPLSTFSTDVDTASYSIVRRYLQQNHRLPPRSAVRIEELLNYFPYDYPQPAEGKPIAAGAELAPCPWNSEHRLLRVGIKARDVAPAQRPLTNLVFLVDVSGSMQSPDKLPLVKDSLRLLTSQMGENDHVAIVVYAGNSGMVLPSTSGVDQAKIRAALDALEAGGSTNGADGIQQAYDVAQASFVKGGVNRVILATDGDFNVGITDRGDLVRLIEEKAASGVFLTTLGFGMGNLKDATLEQLADKGNGNYAYIDNLREAKKVLVEQMSGTLVTVAKDVKVQIEFNPARVASFRLIGYENRILRHEEFNDDRKDAGDIGAGHTVTALYELVPVAQQPAAGKAENKPGVDQLKYQQQRTLIAAADSLELLTLKLRYKQPDAAESQLVEYPVKDTDQTLAQASGDFKFAAAVAEFGMLLRDSPYKGSATFDAARELAQTGRGSDNAGYRTELIDLIGTAAEIHRQSSEHRQ